MFFLLVLLCFSAGLCFAFSIDKASFDASSSSSNSSSGSGGSNTATAPVSNTVADPTARVMGGTVSYMKSSSFGSSETPKGFTPVALGSTSTVAVSGTGVGDTAVGANPNLTPTTQGKFSLGGTSNLSAPGTATASSGSASSTPSTMSSSFKMGQVTLHSSANDQAAS